MEKNDPSSAPQIRVSVTVSLVPEARGGPFVFDSLDAACETAARLGFDGIEVFPRSASELDHATLRRHLSEGDLRLAAMGTGAGWLVQRLNLTNPDLQIRQRARSFIGEIIRVAGEFQAPVIVGSMQGRVEPSVERSSAMGWLQESLRALAEAASQAGTFVLIEPLNRYETNLIRRLEEGVDLIAQVEHPRLKLLADLFHMSIEENSVAASLKRALAHVGHVHFVDSNRWAAGLGHIDYRPLAEVLKEGGYSGYLSAEALPEPDPEKAAAQTMESFRRFFRADARPA